MYSKELLRGTISTLILQVLKHHGRMYGYEIAQKVKELSQERILLKEGSLYPILHKLEADGHVTVQDEHIGKRLRRYYALTDTGKTEAASQVSELQAFMETVRRFIDPLPDLQFSI
ncbi:MAG TPA: PadR family transcriptional regulator [Bacteroidia bacterium]|nr:PadR family transcriptional regulator [Bacteroidia bacterium]